MSTHSTFGAFVAGLAGGAVGVAIMVGSSRSAPGTPHQVSGRGAAEVAAQECTTADDATAAERRAAAEERSAAAEERKAVAEERKAAAEERRLARRAVAEDLGGAGPAVDVEHRAPQAGAEQRAASTTVADALDAPGEAAREQEPSDAQERAEGSIPRPPAEEAQPAASEDPRIEVLSNTTENIFPIAAPMAVPPRARGRSRHVDHAGAAVGLGRGGHALTSGPRRSGGRA